MKLLLFSKNKAEPRLTSLQLELDPSSYRPTSYQSTFHLLNRYDPKNMDDRLTKGMARGEARRVS